MYICAACFASNGKQFPHAESECRNKDKENIIRVNMGMGIRSMGIQRVFFILRHFITVAVFT